MENVKGADRVEATAEATWKAQADHYRPIIERLESELDRAREERANARRRLFGNRQVDGCDHSTACSIWGDDGQGHAEGFDGPLPCNCGALINFAKRERDEARELVRVALEIDDEYKASGDPGEDDVRVAEWRQRARAAVEEG